MFMTRDVLDSDILNPHIVLPYCSMARVGHSGMTADEVTENIEAAVQTVVAKLRMVSLSTQRTV